MKYITRQDELVLLAVYRLGGESSLIRIRELINQTTDKEWSISSVYVPLDRLEKAGYLSTAIGEPTGKRGGKAVKFYQITQEGLQALERVRSVHDAMWDGIDLLVLER